MISRHELQDGLDRLYKGETEFEEPPQIEVLPIASSARPLYVKVNRAALKAQGTVYAPQWLGQVLAAREIIEAKPLTDAAALLRSAYTGGSLLGVAGYAGIGSQCHYRQEAEALSAVYDYLDERNQTPSLAIDGGLSAGMIGISGITARMRKVMVAGVVPTRTGLQNPGVRDHLIAWGKDWGARAAIVGGAPHMLLALGVLQVRAAIVNWGCCYTICTIWF